MRKLNTVKIGENIQKNRKKGNKTIKTGEIEKI